MRMNKTCYLQTDGRWGGLGYPNKPCYIRGCGCGEVAMCNILIELEKYAKYTPKTIQPYMKQFAVPSCDGTIIADIPVAMKHYGMTDVKECDTMADLWKELKKENHVAILLMGSAPAGSKKVHWTGSAHFIAVTGYYKGDDGKHYVYVKDSASTSKSRNGWTTYEGNIRGACCRCFSGKLNGTLYGEPSTDHITIDSKLTVDGIGDYFTVRKTQEYFGTPTDGVISGQEERQAQFYPAWKSVKYGKGGSTCIKAVQKWLGLTEDGIMGQGTMAAWQRRLKDLGYYTDKIDGFFGVMSMKAWQKFLNNNGKELKPVTEKEEPTVKEPITSKDYKVIDVSAYQDPIDWKKVKADGIKGVIVRCGYRGAEKGNLNEDTMFLKHIRGAHEAGLYVGLYFFTEAINGAEGKEEADYTVKLMKKAKVPISYPIAIDTESVNIKGERTKNLTKAKRTEAIKGFCEEIIALGYKPMIYASTSWLNNKLTMSKLPYDVWVAQYASKCEYKGKYVMWQYSSNGVVDGAKGRIDMNHCYIAPQDIYTPVDEKKGYTGKFPSTHLKKTNAEVIDDAITFALWIAGDNRFHYGHGEYAHRNGCYFCETQGEHKKGHGIKDYKFTYCCNPLIGAAWAHGGCVPEALKMCQHCDSYDYHKGKGYDKSDLFDNKGKLDKKKLKKGDVLCRDNHVMLYIGDGKVVHAHGGDDNVKGSKTWNNSINVENLGSKKYSRVHRFNASVDATMPIRHGEVSKRVAQLQAFLDWYFDGKVGKADGIYGDNTYKWTCKFQEIEVGEGEGDGVVGDKTISAMKAVRK